MFKRLFLKSASTALAIIFSAVGLSGVIAAERLKIATPLKLSAVYALPALAAEEKGFWKQEGLQAEWFPFSGGSPFIRALAAGEFDLGMAGAGFLIPAVARGVDALFVADLNVVQPFYVWVRTASPIKGWRDLEGAKIAVSTLGGLDHSLGRAAVKRLGIEGKVRFVGLGGTQAAVAALIAGTVDARVSDMFAMANLKFSGQAREILAIGEYLPKDWMDVSLLSTKNFVEKSPETVRKVVKSTLRATDFVKDNRQWSIEKLKSVLGYSEEAAPEVYKLLTYSGDGKINREGLENVLNFLIEYGIVPKEKAPPVERLFTREFTR